jgi:hypothetical protein
MMSTGFPWFQTPVASPGEEQLYSTDLVGLDKYLRGLSLVIRFLTDKLLPPVEFLIDWVFLKVNHISASTA